MIGRKSVVTISVLCALAFAALAAANASAAQRAYACEEGGAHQWEDEHCLVPNTTTGAFHHQLLPTSATNITVTNARTISGTTAAAVQKLRGTLVGVQAEVQCTGVAGTGSLANAAASVTGTGTLTYSGCTVTQPPGKGCVVTGGSVPTNTLEATTVGQTAGHVLIEPVNGFILATVPISKCSTAALNNIWPVEGSLVAKTNGATATTTHEEVTVWEEFFWGIEEAGLEGAVTINTEIGENGVVLT
jgi:hypothetical protein